MIQIKPGTAWAYVGMSIAGLASIAANILHATLPASPPVGSVIAAALWPIFLFVAIEILAKHAWPDGWEWVAVRIFGLVPVAVVSAVVSYRHMSGLLAAWNEDALTATIGPIAVDGLLVMSTGAIIATGIAKVAEVAEAPAAVQPPPMPTLLPVVAPPVAVETPAVMAPVAVKAPAKAPAKGPKVAPSREQARAILMDLKDFEAEPNLKLARVYGGSDTFWRQRKDDLRAALAELTTEAGNLNR